MEKILIVEDDPEIAESTNRVVNGLGYDTEIVTDGEVAFRKALVDTFEMILLDLSLPSLDGKEVCQKLRDAEVSTPIIVLTSRNSEVDRVLLLELGADDFVGKPFSNSELGARIKAVLRRWKGRADNGKRIDVESLTVGELEIDLARKKVFKLGTEVFLTAGEFLVVEALAGQIGKPISRLALTGYIYGEEMETYVRSVTSFVNRIRQKIEDNPAKPRYLVTARGFGYVLEDPK